LFGGKEEFQRIRGGGRQKERKEQLYFRPVGRVKANKKGK